MDTKERDHAKQVIDSPWMTLAQAEPYTHRGRRFLAREIKAGRLRAARVGGRGEFILRREWCDEWIESQARPVMVMVRGSR